jgi:hypothetical protein
VIREPWQCTWPKGCAQPRALCEGGALCYWHSKVLAGLTDTQDYRERAPPRFDMLSSEQRELAEALRVLVRLTQKDRSATRRGRPNP